MRNLKEVLAEVTTQTKVNLRKAGVGDKVAAITEVRNPFRNPLHVLEVGLWRQSCCSYPGRGRWFRAASNYDERALSDVAIRPLGAKGLQIPS